MALKQPEQNVYLTNLTVNGVPQEEWLQNSNLIYKELWLKPGDMPLRIYSRDYSKWSSIRITTSSSEEPMIMAQPSLPWRSISSSVTQSEYFGLSSLSAFTRGSIIRGIESNIIFFNDTATLECIPAPGYMTEDGLTTYEISFSSLSGVPRDFAIEQYITEPVPTSIVQFSIQNYDFNVKITVKYTYNGRTRTITVSGNKLITVQVPQGLENCSWSIRSGAIGSFSPSVGTFDSSLDVFISIRYKVTPYTPTPVIHGGSNIGDGPTIVNSSDIGSGEHGIP